MSTQENEKFEIEIKKLPPISIPAPAPKEETEEEKEAKKKKKNKHAKVILGLMLITIASFIYIRWPHYKEEFFVMKDIPMSQWIEGGICLVILLVSLFIMGMIIGKINRSHKIRRLEDTGSYLLYEFWMPMAVFFIMFLGWTQKHWGYESHWSENVTRAFVILSNVTNTLRQTGSNFSGFIWFVLFAGFFYFLIDFIINAWSKDNEEYMDAQQLIELAIKEDQEGKYDELEWKKDEI